MSWPNTGTHNQRTVRPVRDATNRYATNRPRPNSASRPGAHVPDRDAVSGMPLDDLLRNLSRWGWTLCAYGDRCSPDPLIAHRVNGHRADVFVMRAEDRCGAYRTNLWPDQDPLTAQIVTWCLTGPVGPVLRLLLTLDDGDPWPDYPMPPELSELMPSARMLPVHIRPPQ